MSQRKGYPTHARRQRGSALLLGMMLLLVMTLLAVFASSTGIMQERMSGNYRDAARAFEAAENAARWGEFWIYSLNTPTERAAALPCGEEGSCSAGDIVRKVGTSYPHAMEEEDKTWWSNNTMVYGDDPGTTATEESIRKLEGTAAQPRFAIEHVGFVPDDLGTPGPKTGLNFYRVTAAGLGGQAENVAHTRTTVVHRFD